MIDILKNKVREVARYCSTVSDIIYRRPSYSQEGEDRVLDRYFGKRGPGFYVDVGAHHPHRYSNTYIFYKRGWRGINIDAMPGSMRPFNRMRKRDINLEMGVGLTAITADFYVFNEPALNTFDENTANRYKNSGWDVREVVNVRIEPLRDILKMYLPTNTEIDFLTIDVEGNDLQVLQSNDWAQFRPRLVLVECLGSTLLDIGVQPTVAFLASVGYVPYAKTANTFVFIRS